MKSAILKFWRDEEGATAIEYGLIAALIAVAAIAGMNALGGGLSDIFDKIGEALKGVNVDLGAKKDSSG